MALSFVGEADAAAASVALPAFNAGDRAFVFAFRDGSTTAPSLPSGWTSIATGGANTCSYRVGYRDLIVSDTTTSTWTNATDIVVLIVRGHDTGQTTFQQAAGSGSSTSMNWPTITLLDQRGGGWVVLLGAHRSATDASSVALTGATNRASGTDTSVAAHTAESVSSWSSTSKTVNANSGWFTVALEVMEGGAADVSQEVAEAAMLPTDAEGRVSQEVVEALALPTDAASRVSQEVVEAVELPTDADARVSQEVVEVISLHTPVAAVSQEVVEYLVQNDAKARVSQAETEVVVSPTDAKARVSQAETEVVVSPSDARARVSQAESEVAVLPSDAKARISQEFTEVVVQNLPVVTGARSRGYIVG